MPKTEAELLAAARAARANAYAPYSGFTVGAALLCDDGTVICGVNVENASYGVTTCAERNALGAAVASGRRNFAAIAIAGPPDAQISPCGACRQALAEFGAGTRVVREGRPPVTIGEMLPDPFDASALRRKEAAT